MKTIVLGLGNYILSDDAIGLILVEKISSMVKAPDIEFQTSEKVGFNLIELLKGYDRAVIVDSILTGKNPPGTIIEYSINELPGSPRLRCPHDVDFKTSIELAKKSGIKMPDEILILGIEIIDNLHFKQELSPELDKNLGSIVKSLWERIKRFSEAN